MYVPETNPGMYIDKNICLKYILQKKTFVSEILSIKTKKIKSCLSVGMEKMWISKKNEKKERSEKNKKKKVAGILKTVPMNHVIVRLQNMTAY